MRRTFSLPESDHEHLEARGLPWETVVDGSQRWLLVHDWPIPSGYNCAKVRLGISIPTTYPDARLDMVYFWPAIARTDGKAIPATTMQTILGENWQRWSRHYSSENPWRVGEDDLSTHLTLIDFWLIREFKNGN